MKKFFLLVAIISGISSFGQSEDMYLTELEMNDARKTTLVKFVNDYFVIAKNLELDKMLDLTHPGIFEVSPRDLIKEQLNSAFDNDYFTMDFTKIEFEGVEDTYAFQGVDYYITKYNSTFKMTFKRSEDQTDEAFEEYMTYLMELYTVQFKDDVVKRAKNVIEISGTKRLLIVDDPSLDGMKMIEIKPGMNNIYKRFIPEIVVDALGNP